MKTVICNQLVSSCRSRISRAESVQKAFTLIELLVVMLIMGILAALVISLSGVASDKRKRSLVEAEKEKLVTAIEAYHDKLGFYPPDNPLLVTKTPNDPASPTYAELAGQNTLYYELTGPAFYQGVDYYTNFDNSGTTLASIRSFFNVGGIRNAAIKNYDADVSYGKNFLHPFPKATQHKTISPGLEVLTVPVELQTGQINPWKYDASTTNRHNLDSFDLWADFSIGAKTVTIGNWKQ